MVHETAKARATRELLHIMTASPTFQVATVIFGAIGAGAGALIVASNANASASIQAGCTVTAALVGYATVVLLSWIFLWATAPIRQRDEAWRILDGLNPDNPFTVDVDNEDSGVFVNLDPNETYARLKISSSRRIERVHVLVESFVMLYNGHEMATTGFAPRKLQWTSFEAKKKGPRLFLNISPGDPPRFVDVVVVPRHTERPIAALVTKDRFVIYERFAIIGLCVTSDSPDKGIVHLEYLLQNLGNRGGSMGNKVYLQPLTPELREQALGWSKSEPIKQSVPDTGDSEN